MELEQMRQLDAIARQGTISAAAEELHLSQPALTVERFPGTLLNPVILPEDEVERRLMNRSVDLAITLKPMILPTMCPDCRAGRPVRLRAAGADHQPHLLRDRCDQRPA